MTKIAFGTVRSGALALGLAWLVGAAGAVEQSNENIRLTVGAAKTITLTENPSTGYRWQLNSAQSTNLAAVKVVDAGYQASTSKLIGAPGTHRWRIEAVAPGAAQIVFDYSRSWEHGAPARRHTVRATVTQN